MGDLRRLDDFGQPNLGRLGEVGVQHRERWIVLVVPAPIRG